MHGEPAYPPQSWGDEDEDKKGNSSFNSSVNNIHVEIFQMRDITTSYMNKNNQKQPKKYLIILDRAIISG